MRTVLRGFEFAVVPAVVVFILFFMPRYPPSVLIYLPGSFLPVSDTCLLKDRGGPEARGECLLPLPAPAQVRIRGLHFEQKKVCEK